MHFFEQGADPASKSMGERFQYNLVVKSHYGFSTAREMKYTSQHCCDKTMDGKMALYRKCCFPICHGEETYKIMVKKRTFAGFVDPLLSSKKDMIATSHKKSVFCNKCHIRQFD